jgi:acetyl-CoA acetyltransferase
MSHVYHHRYDITRTDCDEFAAASHKKAMEATKAGKFKKEIVSMMGKDKEGKEVKSQPGGGTLSPPSLWVSLFLLDG